jgi:hypothetical protein
MTQQQLYKTVLVGGLHDGKSFEAIADNEDELPEVLGYPLGEIACELEPSKVVYTLHIYTKEDLQVTDEENLINYGYAGAGFFSLGEVE